VPIHQPRELEPGIRHEAYLWRSRGSAIEVLYRALVTSGHANHLSMYREIPLTPSHDSCFVAAGGSRHLRKEVRRKARDGSSSRPQLDLEIAVGMQEWPRDGARPPKKNGSSRTGGEIKKSSGLVRDTDAAMPEGAQRRDVGKRQIALHHDEGLTTTGGAEIWVKIQK